MVVNFSFRLKIKGKIIKMSHFVFIQNKVRWQNDRIFHVASAKRLKYLIY